MNSKTIKDALGKVAPLIALIILFIILSFLTDKFFTVNNMMNILKQTAVNGLISAAMLVVLITAGIDLSVGANAVVGACMMGMLKEMGITSAGSDPCLYCYLSFHRFYERYHAYKDAPAASFRIHFGYEERTLRCCSFGCIYKDDRRLPGYSYIPWILLLR
jgi:ribose/xylose/arabinose/galactoside ABC-type transport system permease subunit